MSAVNLAQSSLLILTTLYDKLYVDMSAFTVSIGDQMSYVDNKRDEYVNVSNWALDYNASYTMMNDVTHCEYPEYKYLLEYKSL